MVIWKKNKKMEDERISFSERFPNETEDIHLHKTFDSYKEVEAAIVRYQKSTNSAYYKRDGRKVKQARKRLKMSLDENEYYFVHYCCIHGGKNFKSMSEGLRKTKTWNIKCPAFFKVHINEEGNKYYIHSLFLEHNHTNKERVARVPHIVAPTTPEPAAPAEGITVEIHTENETYELDQQIFLATEIPSTTQIQRVDSLFQPIPDPEHKQISLLKNKRPCTLPNTVGAKDLLKPDAVDPSDQITTDKIKTNQIKTDQTTSDQIEFLDEDPLQIEITSTTLPALDASHCDTDISHSDADIQDDDANDGDDGIPPEQPEIKRRKTCETCVDVSQLLRVDKELLAIKREKNDIAQQQLAAAERHNDLLEKRNQIETQKTAAFNNLAYAIKMFAMNRH